MADLGLADILRSHPVHNAAVYNRNGTPHWHPPELRYLEVNKTNAFYPFADPIYVDPDKNNPHRKGYHPVSSRVNVWSIGAVMMSLMTLKEPDFLHRRVRSILREERPLPRGPDESIVKDSDFAILEPQYYSQALRDLIKDCMKFLPQDRPSEETLLDRAINGYQANLQTLRNMGYGPDHGPSNDHPQPNQTNHPAFNYDQDYDEDFPQETYSCLQEAINCHPDYALYYVENEIDSAPDNCEFDHPGRDALWYSCEFVSDLIWVPPHWGRLWPEEMPLDVPVPWDWPAGYRADFEQTRDTMIRGRLAAAAASLQRATEQGQFDPAPYHADAPGFARLAVNPDQPGAWGQQAEARAPYPPAYGNPGGFVAINAGAGGGVPAVVRQGVDTPFPAMQQGVMAVGGGGGPAQPAVPDVAMGGDDDSSSVGDVTALPRGGGPIRENRNVGRYQPYFIPRRGGRR